MSTNITLRTQPTCNHCLKDDRYSAIARYVTMDGQRAECAGCGMSLGDAKELSIPINAQSIYRTLIKRAAMRVKYFNVFETTEVDVRDTVFVVTMSQISFASRAAREHTVQSDLDWYAFDATLHQPKSVTPAAGNIEHLITTFPACVTLAASVFLNDDFVVIQVPREGASTGSIRFRKVQTVSVSEGPSVFIQAGDKTLVDTRKERQEQHVIRGQISW